MRFRVTAPLQLHPGALLGLTAEQAQARSYGLQPEGALWRVTRPVGFKAGEEFEHEGDLPKALACAIEPLTAQPSTTPKAVRKPATRKAPVVSAGG